MKPALYSLALVSLAVGCGAPPGEDPADAELFGITRHGLVPPYAPADYKSDMPAFAGQLGDDDIRAVLAFIKSHWRSGEVLAARAQMLRNK